MEQDLSLYEVNATNVGAYAEGNYDPDTPSFTCVICRNRTCIDSSFSCRGHLLTCADWFRTSFDSNCSKLFRWMECTYVSVHSTIQDILPQP